MRYVKARIEHTSQAETYRIYISEGLKALTHNTASFMGGYELKKSYSDLQQKQELESRTPEEIINGISNKLNKIGKGV